MSKDTHKFNNLTPRDVWERVIGAHERLWVLENLFNSHADVSDNPSLFIGTTHILGDVRKLLSEIFGDIERVSAGATGEEVMS
jgi:hypothetical protein